jgi:hypothetical protein
VSRSALPGPGGGVLKQRWTLDFPEDDAFLHEVFARLPAPPAIPDWRTTLAIIDADPSLSSINAARRVAR